MIKKYIDKIITKFLHDNPDLILDILEKHIEKKEKESKAYEFGLELLNSIEKIQKNKQHKYQCEYYGKVKKNKRYFAQRIENGKINNFAPSYATHVVILIVERSGKEEFIIDYGDLFDNGNLDEKAKIHRDVVGSDVIQNKHYSKFVKFFDYDVGKEDAIESILVRLRLQEKKRV